MNGLFLLTTVIIPLIAGHGAMITPPSRNAVDRHLAGFNATQAYDCNCGCCNQGCGGQGCTKDALNQCGNPGARTN
eukprot:gene29725-18632_t